MKVMLACGGTGGHLFPGMALAECFEEKVPGIEIVFVGTPRGLEKEVLSKTKWRLEMMKVPSLADKKNIEKIGALFGLAGSFAAAFSLLRRERPDLVAGTGGYASGPVMLTASLMKKPTLTLEPNAVPGMTNRMLRKFVDRVVVPYPGLKNYFGAEKTKVFGVPVRRSLLKEAAAAVPLSGKKTVFIFGGSQGAKKINETILKTLPLLNDLKEKIHFVHQIGRQASAGIFEKGYRENGFSAEVYPFIANIGSFYGKSDFVIARAGAASLAELVALKIPSLLIPYPFSAGGHQQENAQALELAGGAKMLSEKEANEKNMAAILRDWTTSEEALKKMKSNLRKLGGEEAAQKIVEECLTLMGFN